MFPALLHDPIVVWIAPKSRPVFTDVSELESIRDFFMIEQDKGMLPKEIFCMRIEHIDWENMRIWNPHGKTAKARRFVPMSERMKVVLSARCGLTKEGWVFPSPRSKTGHLNSIAVGFRSLRARTGVSSKIVPYSARHTYGSFTVEATGNIFAVADSMGDMEVQSIKPYQHHRLDSLRDAIHRRNKENAARHVSRHAVRTWGLVNCSSEVKILKEIWWTR